MIQKVESGEMIQRVVDQVKAVNSISAVFEGAGGIHAEVELAPAVIDASMVVVPTRAVTSPSPSKNNGEQDANEDDDGNNDATASATTTAGEKGIHGREEALKVPATQPAAAPVTAPIPTGKDKPTARPGSRNISTDYQVIQVIGATSSIHPPLWASLIALVGAVFR